jgi:hypothetical protein
VRNTTDARGNVGGRTVSRITNRREKLTSLVNKTVRVKVISIFALQEEMSIKF